MKKHLKIWFGIAVGLAVIGVTAMYLRQHMVSVLQPVGQIGHKERNLIAFTAALSVVVVVPVFAMLGYFAWHYREGNKRATYKPDMDGNALAESVWWLIPTILLVIIGTITWRSSYALDPFKPLASSKKTLHVQVVALDWKWLFIYPNQNVASVNQVAVPVGTPVDFEITSDTVMTSFWAPRLGGQMYAMPGMSTHLNLMAGKPGSYDGVAANISGKGFAGMKFTVKAVSDSQFTSWIQAAQKVPHGLTAASYAALAKPTANNPVRYYQSVQPALYDTIVFKYMTPTPITQTATGAAL
jgi:cytochrome o ubiquinol oxidase subunit 2